MRRRRKRHQTRTTSIRECADCGRLTAFKRCSRCESIRAEHEATNPQEDQ